jgi:hypothetical protein
VIFSDDPRTDSGRMLERQILARVPDARMLYVDARSAAGMRASVSGSGSRGRARNRRRVCGSDRGQGAAHCRRWSEEFGCHGRRHCSSAHERFSIALPSVPSSSLWAILTSCRDFPAIQNYVCAFSNVNRVGNSRGKGHLRRNCDRRSSAGYDSRHVASRGEGMERPAQPNAARPSSGGSSDVRQNNVR